MNRAERCPKRHWCIALSLTCVFLLAACGSDASGEQEYALSEGENAATGSEVASGWDAMPMPRSADLQETGACPPQWATCGRCTHRTYVADERPDVICTFYEEQMPTQGWDEIVYQSYPERSCMGTWIADPASRVLVTVGELRDQEHTLVGITLGMDCP